MKQPEFTPEEEYIIAFYRDKNNLSYMNLSLTELSCTVATLICIILGLYKDDIILVAAGFVPVVCLTFLDIVRSNKYSNTIHNIFIKYEAATKEGIKGNTEQDA